MLDLETLSSKSNAVIVSMGAVYFGGDKTGKTFYRVLDDLEQQEVGRHISQDTLKWWAGQSEEAQKVLYAKGISATAALEEFSEFLGDKNIRVWGNGADFDNIILGSLYDDLSLKRPWSYSNNRCFRTIKNILSADAPARKGTHHNALDDAIYQAEWAIALLKGTIRG